MKNLTQGSKLNNAALNNLNDYTYVSLAWRHDSVVGHDSGHLHQRFSRVLSNKVSK